MAADRPPNSTQPSPRPDITTPSRPSRRAWLILGLVVAVLALAILPPFLSVSRFQRRITTSISQALGRPVHLDHVALHLLPFPAFAIDNLVIDELPPFGDEPIIRANTVSARLRLTSLWRRRVEFSRITFTDPSINLVRNPDGHWNLESFLLQAAHISAAPTAQPRAGSAPRFPYIEATGARINLKLAQRKTPFSLTEAELALWLPEPQQWKLRLRGRPARTDTGVTDTGLFQTEATLERAGAVGQVPLTLDASWIGAPLGEASRVLTGADAGLRGNLSLTTHLTGTLDAASVQLELRLNGLHRADLIPDHLVDIDLVCNAGATRLLHTVSDLHCLWPLPESVQAELLHRGANPSRLTLAGSIPDILTPTSADLGFSVEHVSAETLLTWARATTGRLAPGLHAAGELNGTATWPGAKTAASAELDLTHLALSGSLLGSAPITLAPVALTGTTPFPGTLAGATLELAPVAISFGHSGTQRPPSPSAPGDSTAGPTADAQPLNGTLDSTPDNPANQPASDTPTSTDLSSAKSAATASPAPTTLGAETGSTATASLVGATGSTATGSLVGAAMLSGTATTQGFSAHLTGLVPLARLLALGADVPSFGAGLAQTLPTNRAAGPTRVDLSVHRLWGAAPLWTSNLSPDGSAPTPRNSLATARHKPRHHR